MGLFGTSGIRKKISEISPEFAVRLGRSLALSKQSGKEIAVAVDTRTSSEFLKNAFISGIISTGKDVIDLGMASTPTLCIAAKKYGTGVMITASHNPPEYNGFKFWSNKGAFNKKEEKEVEENFSKISEDAKEVKEIQKKISHEKLWEQSWKNTGKVYYRDFIEEHINTILNTVKIKKKIKVVVDCCNGAASNITPILLRKMGCDVLALNSNPTGFFHHMPEPTKENLKETIKIVKTVNADIGIAHDGDADRCAVITKDGDLVEWDDFLAVLAYGKNVVVSTVDASARIDRVCARVIRTPVGDVAVSNAIALYDADFGGEPSGACIFPEVYNFPDGCLTAAKIVEMVSENVFYETLDRIPKYFSDRVKIPCDEDIKERAMEKIKKEISGDYTDGVRVSDDDGFVLIRPSGTEPFIRITAESKNKETLNKKIKEIKEKTQKIIYSLSQHEPM